MVTRRRVAVLAALGAAANIALPQGAAPARAQEDPDLETAREQARANAQQIRQVKLPMTTEPAVHFAA